MKTKLSFFFMLAAGFFALSPGTSRAEARPGTVTWSDGRAVSGDVSLTPGKDLRLFTGAGQVTLQLSEVKELRFKPEKEETREGFYFPNAGQATQAKTGDVYPVRYLQTQITLADGKVLEGHLFTTTFYVETDAATEKVVVMAKQTGADGQKPADVIYPTLIHFDTPAVDAGSSRIDLSLAGLLNPRQFVAVATPDLGLLQPQQVAGSPVWTVPMGDPGRILFSVEATDGLHVAWPQQQADPAIQQAVQTSLTEMRDFYDTRTLLGCFSGPDPTDVYSLVLMKRLGKTYTFDAGKIPWSVVILRSKYDPDAKKTTLLNRVSLLTGREEDNSPVPTVFKQASLLMDISAQPANSPPAAP